MMMNVAVTSRSFSKNAILRHALKSRYQQIAFNESGKTLEGEELIHFLKDCDKAIIGLEKMDAEILSKLPKLKSISRFGVGIDNIDMASIKRYGIKLACAHGANKRAVAELVVAFAIMMLRKLPRIYQDLTVGLWNPYKGRQLSSCNFGIIGLGAIGKELVNLLKPFECKVFAYDNVIDEAFCHTNHVQAVHLENLLEISDIVSLHLPLNSTTQHLINHERLLRMKNNSIIINTARGGLVDEQALTLHLKSNPCFSAAVDVYSDEPPTNMELLKFANLFCTSHIAGNTEESILAMGYAAINGLENAL